METRGNPIISRKSTNMVQEREIGSLISTNGPPWFDKKCSQYKSAYLKAFLLLREPNSFTRLMNVRNVTEFYRAMSYYRPGKFDFNYMELVSISQFREHYESLFNYPRHIHVPNTHVNEQDPELDGNFTLDDLDVAIQRLASRKAPGPDGVPNEVWKALTLEQKCKIQM
jgi:hypothetical protein